MLTISGKSIGSRSPLFADFSVPAPPEASEGDGGLTLRDLITRIVLHETEAFRRRQERRRLTRVLSPRQIEQAAAKGKIDPGGSDLEQRVDDAEAIGAALQAFEDGLYLVIIDGREHRDLDSQIYLRPDSRITFVRLVFLAGA